MKKIVFMLGMSLDGFIEDANGSGDWHRIDEDILTDIHAELDVMSAYLNGRVVYEEMESFWPTADSGPDATAHMKEYAAIYRRMPKFVYSRTLDSVKEGDTLVRDVVAEEVLALKAEPGGDLCLGGANLAATFRHLGLIDEYSVRVHPVVLGGGKPMFELGTRDDLRLIESRTYKTGVVWLRYAVEHPTH